MNNHKALKKYLARYSSCFCDEHSRYLKQLLKCLRSNDKNNPDCDAQPSYQHCTVIPAFNESIDFIQRFAKIPTTHRQLLIVVANCPTYASEAAKLATKTLIKNSQQSWAKQNVIEGVTFGQINSKIDLLLLDITQQRCWLKPLQSGVGFARKAGMDLALNLWQQGSIFSPWFYSSDADAFWPDNYLNFIAEPNCTPLLNPTKKGAAVFAFQHQQSADNAGLDTAAAMYDCSLRYYVLGLRWANSLWGYHTIGSTLMIHGLSYAETRGFPIREAGEDFYLLNKIAKTANIYNLPMPKIKLSDRASQRVPFGTGPAVSNIQQQACENDFLMYHPIVFALLKIWHSHMPQLFTRQLDEIFVTAAVTEKESQLIIQGLHGLGFEKALKHCRQQAKNQAQFTKQLWQWFDGFRTLKFIHWLRDNNYPSIGFSDWMGLLQQQQVPFITTENKIESAIALSQQLQQLEIKRLPITNGLQ